MKKMLIEIPEELHKEFKVQCAKNGESMIEAINDLMKYYIMSTPKLKNDDGEK